MTALWSLSEAVADVKAAGGESLAFRLREVEALGFLGGSDSCRLFGTSFLSAEIIVSLSVHYMNLWVGA